MSLAWARAGQTQIPVLGIMLSGPKVLAKDPSQGPGQCTRVLEFVHQLQAHLICPLLRRPSALRDLTNHDTALALKHSPRNHIGLVTMTEQSQRRIRSTLVFFSLPRCGKSHLTLSYPAGSTNGHRKINFPKNVMFLQIGLQTAAGSTKHGPPEPAQISSRNTLSARAAAHVLPTEDVDNNNNLLQEWAQAVEAGTGTGTADSSNRRPLLKCHMTTSYFCLIKGL